MFAHLQASPASAAEASQTAVPTVSSSAAPSTAAPSATVVYERPPPGIAQGRYPVKGWMVAALVGALIVAIVLFVVLRRRRLKRKREYESIAPQSMPLSSRR